MSARHGARAPRRAAVGAMAVLGTLVLPDVAVAHGIVGKTDLPIPRWLFAWAAALVLIVSFVALATLWPKPRLEHARQRVLVRYARWLEVIGGAIGLALYAIVVYAGFAGVQDAPNANLAPTFIYVLFWVGLPIASLLAGDVFRVLNPWRTIARLVAWAAARVARQRAPEPLRYPPGLGRWPAAVGILAFAWLELIYVHKDRPSTLSILALAYGAIQLLGMGLYGIETWTSRGDAFSVYFNLFARLSPLRWYRDRLELTLPLAGVGALDQLPGTTVLLAVMIGSTSFDGLEQGSLWLQSIGPGLQDLFSSLGSGPAASLELAATIGLLGMALIVGGLYRLGIRGMQSIDRHTPRGRLADRFVHSLIPIALAYVVAHYWSLFVYQGQAALYLASDPLGHGANLFGTAHDQVNYNLLSANSIWYVQVGALILGHAAGLALAHDRALVMYRRAQDAVRSQYWMLAIMVAFTSLGLWLLSAAN